MRGWRNRFTLWRLPNQEGPLRPEHPDDIAHALRLEIREQPDNVSCGPTCLHGVYRYFGDEIRLRDVVKAIEPLPEGGTLEVNLGCHALERGYQATIISSNLRVFDPTWRDPKIDLKQKLTEQSKAKRSSKLRLATSNYLRFIELGGKISLEPIRISLIRKYLKEGLPILTGLSATYLYGCAREHEDEYDDVKGEPSGHFVVVSGYDPKTRLVNIADPLADNPGFSRQYYSVSLERLVASIHLGILTYDAGLLIIRPSTNKAVVTKGKTTRVSDSR